MIKGVNKQIIEINSTRNEYIEKAILFINPQKAQIPQRIINQKAQSYLTSSCGEMSGGEQMETQHRAIRSKRFFYSSIIGATVTIALSVLFHFLYEWTGRSFFVGLFTAQSESVFEHTKILFFPFLIYSLVELIVLKPYKARFIASKAIPLLLLPVVMISVFYTYTGIIGYSIPAVDIASAFIYIALAFYLSYRLMRSRHSIERLNVILLPIAAVFAVGIVLLSIYPPSLPLFVSP